MIVAFTFLITTILQFLLFSRHGYKDPESYNPITFILILALQGLNRSSTCFLFKTALLDHHSQGSEASYEVVKTTTYFLCNGCVRLPSHAIFKQRFKGDPLLLPNLVLTLCKGRE
jgi:hypothetical protein